MQKYVYFFGGGKAEGTGTQKELLGGKGAGLAEMTLIGLPVPAGFTITIHNSPLWYYASRIPMIFIPLILCSSTCINQVSPLSGSIVTSLQQITG